MAVKLFVLGDTKEVYFKQSEAEYLKRISKYTNFTYTTLPSSKKHKTASACLAIEGETLLKQISSKDYLILLDEKGSQYSSRQFADNLNKWTYSHASLVFVIGGAFGFAPEVKTRANAMLSLSKMTYPHHMVRTIFLEQLYRGFTILKGEKYHND